MANDSRVNPNEYARAIAEGVRRGGGSHDQARAAARTGRTQAENYNKQQSGKK